MLGGGKRGEKTKKREEKFYAEQVDREEKEMNEAK